EIVGRRAHMQVVTTLTLVRDLSVGAAPSDDRRKEVITNRCAAYWPAYAASLIAASVQSTANVDGAPPCISDILCAH
ncbi:unnamed protein product, partial [Effrenium voratum]